MREKTAELLAKMLADKLVGPKVRIILTKFLPSIFMDAMRDSAEASVHMFEGQCCVCVCVCMFACVCGVCACLCVCVCACMVVRGGVLVRMKPTLERFQRQLWRNF